MKKGCIPYAHRNKLLYKTANIKILFKKYTFYIFVWHRTITQKNDKNYIPKNIWPTWKSSHFIWLYLTFYLTRENSWLLSDLSDFYLTAYTLLLYGSNQAGTVQVSPTVRKTNVTTYQQNMVITTKKNLLVYPIQLAGLSGL